MGEQPERLRVARRLLPHARLTVGTRWMTRPLCSIEFPRLHRSYGSLRPCASHRASHPWGSAPWISPFTSRRQVPTFHTRSLASVLLRYPNRPDRRREVLVQGHATFMPGAAQPSCRLPLDSSRVNDSPRFRHRPYAFDTLPVVHPLRLPAPYLTRSRRAVSVTLTTPALDRSSARRFGASPCRAAPRGLPSSLVQHGCS